VTVGEEFASILAAAQAGEEWAVAVLYRDLNPLLLRYLRARHASEADDLAAEVWLAAARQLPGFVGDEAGFRGWLFTIARRQLIATWRREGRRRTRTAPAETFDAVAAPDDTEAAALGGSIAQEAVDKLLAGLPPDQAEVVLLRVVAGLGVAQVAEIMGKRPGTVRVLQHRALRRLAQIHGKAVVTG
jgi:RNA polymerase sigma-70 factor (ECF subfamily)